MTEVVPTRGSIIRLRRRSSAITHVIATAVEKTVPASLPWQAVPLHLARPWRPVSTSRWDGVVKTGQCLNKIGQRLETEKCLGNKQKDLFI